MTGTGRSVGGVSAEEMDRIRRILDEHGVSFAVVFGSAAHGARESRGDIDLAVEFAKVRPTSDGYSNVFLGLLVALDVEFDGDIDIVDIHTLTPEFARAVFDTGVVIMGVEKRRGKLERELAAESLTVSDARERITNAVAHLKEAA